MKKREIRRRSALLRGLSEPPADPEVWNHRNPLKGAPMGKPTANGATSCYAKLQPAGLTVAQENAVDALVSGKNDAETAALVGVNRVTVTRWRLYSPAFIAALNVRRAEVWSVAADQLRALLPKAVAALGAELDNPDSPHRVKAAVELLKLVTPTGPAVGPTDPDEVLRRHVEQRRERLKQERGWQEENESNKALDLIDGLTPLPGTEKLAAAVLAELEARAAEPAAIRAPERG